MKFISVDSNGLINGMYVESPKNGIEFDEKELASQQDRGLIEISEEEYTSVGPGFRYIDGELLPALEPTPEEIAAESLRVNNIFKEYLLSEAAQRIVIWQTKLIIGRKLSDSENKTLNAWMDYIDEVESVKTDTTEEITWPPKPE